RIAFATGFFASWRRSSTLVTTGMARHSTMHANHGCRQRRAEKPDPGDRAYDAPARCAGAASRAARAEADLAVYGPASVDRPPHPRRDVWRPAGGPRRAWKLPARHAAA